MKLLIIAIALMVAWKAGYILLMAGFMAGFYLVRDGSKRLLDGDITGRKRIDLGAGLGVSAALLLILFNLCFVLLTLASLAAVFPAFLVCIKAALAWIGVI